MQQHHYTFMLVLRDARAVEGEYTQNTGKASIGIWGRDMGNNEVQENRREVNTMRMLRWIGGVTKIDNIRNKDVRGSVKVAPVTKKITEKR